MKNSFLIIVYFVVCISLYGQDLFIANNNQTYRIVQDELVVNIITDSTLNRNALAAKFNQNNSSLLNIIGKSAILKGEHVWNNDWEKNLNQRVIITPVVMDDDGSKIILSNSISCKLKKEGNINRILDTFSLKYNKLDVSKIRRKAFTFEISEGDVVEICNTLFSSELFEYAEPNTFVEVISDSDPYFHEQYIFRADGTNSTYIDGDMDILEAHWLTKGAGGVVCVMDPGNFDFDHEDVMGSYIPGFYVNNNGLHWDMSGFGGASNYHGQQVAGIIGAVADNDIGIRGVAPNSSIFPVQLVQIRSDRMEQTFEAITQRSDIAVVSCSWHIRERRNGVPSTPLGFYAAQDAMINYTINGRGGKGGVLVCASTNDESYPDEIWWPGIMSAGITVGAIDKNDSRLLETGYGAKLDVTAYGEDIRTTNNSTYTLRSGTSFSTPIVAGIAQLIIAANPSLTSSQVRHFIESGCDKVNDTQYNYQTFAGHPEGSWNEYTGYGRVNAFRSIQAAWECNTPMIFDYASFEENLEISGCTIEVKNSNIKNGVSLIINGQNSVVLNKGFLLESGGQLKIN